MPSNTPQGMLYQMRGQNSAPSDGNSSRNRSAEQYNSGNSGNPYNYQGTNNMDWRQYLNGQDPSLGRYTPPTLSSRSTTNPTWNNNVGGYGYNLPTSFGGFGGFSQYSQQPQQGGFAPPRQGGFNSNAGAGGYQEMPGSGSDQEGAMQAQAGMQDNNSGMMGQMVGMQGYSSQGQPTASVLQNMLRGFQMQPPQQAQKSPIAAAKPYTPPMGNPGFSTNPATDLSRQVVPSNERIRGILQNAANSNQTAMPYLGSR